MKHEPFFEDSGELDHVLYLLSENAKELADLPLSDEEAAFHLGNCPLVRLKKRLKEELIKSKIEPSEIEDTNELLHLVDRPSLTEYQIACIEALIIVYQIDSFSELAERLEELKGKLNRVHITSSDGAVFDAYKTSLAQKKRAQKNRPDALNNLIAEILKADGINTSWRQVVKSLKAENGQGVIESINDDHIEYFQNDKVISIPTRGVKDRTYREKKKLLKNPKK